VGLMPLSLVLVRRNFCLRGFRACFRNFMYLEGFGPSNPRSVVSQTREDGAFPPPPLLRHPYY